MAVKVEGSDHHLKVVIADDGVGMPDTKTRTGFGTRLIRTLARQLQAEVLWTAADPGTMVELRLPIQPISGRRLDG